MEKKIYEPAPLISYIIIDTDTNTFIEGSGDYESVIRYLEAAEINVTRCIKPEKDGYVRGTRLTRLELRAELNKRTKNETYNWV